MTEHITSETNRPLNQLFDKAVLARSDAIAVIAEERRISFFELQLYVEWMAGYFQSINLQPGQRVALLMPNSPEVVISFWGLMRAGGVAVPLDVFDDEQNLRTSLLRSHADAVITTPQYKQVLDKILSAFGRKGISPCLTIAVFEEDNITTLKKNTRVAENGRMAAIVPPSENGGETRQAEDCFHQGGSQATAGYPAVVQLQYAHEFFVYTHEELEREAEALIARTQLGENDRVVCCAPLCQEPYLSHCLIAAMAAGAAVVLAESDKWENFLQTLTGEQVTVFAGPVGLLRRLTASDAAPSLRWYFCLDAVSPELDGGLGEKPNFHIGQFNDTINTGVSFQL
ncbi:MAG: AMP-binding protein [candidate division KSB1 bacterium]|nr:AMP-binding protein [candidate division KSB1 bacterium]MDZ7368187.1 AMP-binding protein [candidate division KSB1 bacterium]MDZ7405922.1 AMP-binding protein [candidate division KSB1 bacterium]